MDHGGDPPPGVKVDAIRKDYIRRPSIGVVWMPGPAADFFGRIGAFGSTRRRLPWVSAPSWTAFRFGEPPRGIHSQTAGWYGAGVPVGAGEVGISFEESAMRMRIISAAVVLGLGIVGITLARQTGEARGDDKAKLRTQVARLRAEVELRQIEHDVDADILKKLMTDMRNLEGLESLKAPVEEQLKSATARKAPEIGYTPPGFEEFRKQAQEEAKATQLNELTAKVARPLLERLKKEFVQKAAELNEKRLELADVEKRYNEAK